MFWLPDKYTQVKHLQPQQEPIQVENILSYFYEQMQVDVVI